MALWHPRATVEEGPGWKRNAGPRRGKGAVVHSAEGSRQGALDVLRGAREASWHFTVCKSGELLQHYARDVQAWHAGAKANPFYVGIECEGVAGEALTPAQVGTVGEVLRWLEQEEGWPGMTRGETLFEHREFMSTACPSGRIPWPEVVRAAQPAKPAPVPTARDIAFAGAVAAMRAQEGQPLSGMHGWDKYVWRWVNERL